MLRLVVISCVVVLAMLHGPARAETVALLPLDSEKRLEIYGQPVASEIARALKAGGIDVVVVGAKMGVPDGAQLIVDGSIKGGKGDAITLSIRVRDPRDGTVLETLAPATTSLANIDRAAAELSARVVPSVKTHLQALAQPTIEPAVMTGRPREPAAPPALPALLSAITATTPAGATVTLLRGAFDAELASWARTHERQPTPIDSKAAWRQGAPKLVASGGGDVALLLHVLAFSVTPGKIPLARARVRVRVVDREKVRFDRVVVTDTIVGDRDITPEELAGRAAREVLLIMHPHLRRMIATWK